MMVTKFSEDLTWRGLIKDKTFADPAWLDKPRTFYLGIDSSSDSLTVGNLAVILLAKRFIDSGWKAVIVAGGATSQVGDPGGKDVERELKSKAEVAANLNAIKAQIERLLAGSAHEVVNNLDWLGDIRYLDFLRDVGKNFSMSELMQRDFVAARIGDNGVGISYAEFSYSLLQGYDYWWLFKNKSTVLQIGGSDQWGNMLSGVSLVRKKEAKEVQAMSMPLVLNRQTGKKFGKSETGTIWLDSAKTSPTQFFQFWINSSDEDVLDYLKQFTLLPATEIEKIMTQHNQDPTARKAQKTLAEEVTKLVHGADQSSAATGVSKYLTGQAPVASANPAELAAIRREISAVKSRADGSIIEVLSSAGLASSNTEARRLLATSSIYINDQPVTRENFKPSDFQNGRLILRRGKAYKDSALVEF